MRATAPPTREPFRGVAGAGDERSGGWGYDKIADADTCIQYTGSQWSGDQRDTYEQNYYAGADLEMAEQVCTATGGTWSTP